MASVLVVGYGNTLRSDDGAGWRAAEELAARDLPPAVKVVKTHQLAPELAATASRFDALLFVDAARGDRAGEIRCAHVGYDAMAGLTHRCTPSSIVAIAKNLYGASPVADEITLTGASFEVGEELTAEIAAVLPRLVERVEERARELCGAQLVHA